jgi:hypothetical protein
LVEHLLDDIDGSPAWSPAAAGDSGTGATLGTWAVRKPRSVGTVTLFQHKMVLTACAEGSRGPGSPADLCGGTTPLRQAQQGMEIPGSFSLLMSERSGAA